MGDYVDDCVDDWFDDYGDDCVGDLWVIVWEIVWMIVCWVSGAVQPFAMASDRVSVGVAYGSTLPGVAASGVRVRLVD